MSFSEQAPAANSAMSSFIHAGRQWRGVAEVLRWPPLIVRIGKEQCQIRVVRSPAFNQIKTAYET
jgi:hypothetical protein